MIKAEKDTTCGLPVIRIVEAHAGRYLREARALFEEYARSLGISLEFQGFAEELSSLPGCYAPPHGCILIALHQQQTAGCAALRRLDDDTCEMKRLYTRPQHRGQRVGLALAQAIMEVAHDIGYARMRLDTLPTMHDARTLYSALGFREIEPYRYNPIEGTTYMELALVHTSATGSNPGKSQ